MTVDCLWETQKAVFTALDGDGPLSGLVTGVYSHVPQDTAYPYVKFAQPTGKDWSSKTFDGMQISFQLDIFSRERGAKESLDIMVEIKRILDGAILSMTGCTMVDMHFTDETVRELSDGLTWQGRIGFEVWVEKA